MEAELQHELLWGLILRIEGNFKNLERLRLLSQSRSLSPILKQFRMQKLKTLEIQNLWMQWHQDHMELEPEKRRTASFTTLRLVKFGERPTALFHLLQWPTVLTRFELDSICNDSFPLAYPTLETWLLVHQNSLKHISIGHLSWGGSQRRFNAAIFPNLEFLRLSRWQIQSPLQFTPEDANILGPSLKTFVWDFSTQGHIHQSWRDFGEAEAAWIWELAACAVSRETALTRIEIQYEPCECPHDATEEMEYPWDRMDTVKDQILKPNGLQLSYNKPPISKERWSELIMAGKCEGGCIMHWEEDVAEAMFYDAAESEHEQSSTDDELKSPAWSYEGEDIRKYMIEMPKARS